MARSSASGKELFSFYQKQVAQETVARVGEVIQVVNEIEVD